MEAHHGELVKAAEGVLLDLVTKHDVETLKLLEEAAAQEKGECWYISMYPLFPLFQMSECLKLGMFQYVSDYSTLQIFLFFLASTKGFTLTALAAFNKNTLSSTQQLGADVLRSIQELQLEHWGSAKVGILSDDTVQELILGTNKLLDLSLSMERKSCSISGNLLYELIT